MKPDTKSDALAAISAKFSAFDIAPHCLAIGVIGSDSHGTKIAPENGGIDDTDYMGIVLPPARHLIGLGTWEHWVYPPDANGLDVTLYSLKKFVGLLLKSNPNVLGFLWLRPDFYVHASPALVQLIEARAAFASKQAYPSFIGYAHSQIRKMEANVFNGYMGDKRKRLVEKHGYDTKNASHLIRLLRTGIEFLNTGTINVYREDADELVAIKRGAWSLESVKRESARLFLEAEEAKNASTLPEDPDYDRAEQVLMAITREAISEERVVVP